MSGRSRGCLVLPDMFSSFDSTMGQLDGLIEKAEALSEAAARLGEMDIESLNSGINYADDLLRRTEEGIVQSLTAIRQSRSSFRDASGRGE